MSVGVWVCGCVGEVCVRVRVRVRVWSAPSGLMHVTGVLVAKPTTYSALKPASALPALSSRQITIPGA